MKKIFWAMALAALAAPGGAAAANGESGLLRQMPGTEARPGAAGQSKSMGFVFQQVRPCAKETGYSRAEEDFSVLYLDREPDNDEWENTACKNRAGLAAAAGKARLSLGPDKNAPLAGSAAAAAQG